MARMTPVNSDLDVALSRLGSPEAVMGLRHGIEGALGVAPGVELNPAEYPLLALYFSSSAEQFLAYFVTPGRFIRYEVAGGRSMTVAVPLSRVCRVVEVAAATELAVTVELDADATTGMFETRTEPDGAARNGRAMARLTRTGYELIASDADQIARLAAFSRALRSALGA